MTVTTNTNKVQALGNGVTTAFPYPFRIYSASDLVVTSTVIATGVDTTLVLNTDYTVTGAGSYNGGNVVMTTAPADGTRITVRRVLTVTQGTDLRNQGGYFAETHEDVFDRQTMVDQQQQEEIDRSFKLPDTASGVSSTLPLPTARRALVWNADGSALVNSSVDPDAAATQAAASAGAAAISANAASSSAAEAAATFAEFDARFLGAKATDPTTNNEGGALEAGALYFNTTDSTLRLYDGANWSEVGATLDDGEVTTPKLADGAVTAAKLGDDVSFTTAINVMDHGATGDGVADDTTALNAAYAAAKAIKGQVFLPVGTYRFTSQLVFDGSVDVLGENSEYTILKKDGDFDAISIAPGAGQGRYSDFTLTAVNDVAGDGIVISASTRGRFLRVTSSNNAGRGWVLEGASPIGFFTVFDTCSATSNGSDGWQIAANFYRSHFENCVSTANGGCGLNVLNGNDYHTGQFTTEQNTSGGVQIAAQQCKFEIYAEANTGLDFSLTSASVRNEISVRNVDSTAEISDEGTNNIVTDLAIYSTISTPRIQPLPRTTNVAGREVVFKGGAAGSGATAYAGGKARLVGGDPAGTGNVDGCNVDILGGEGLGTGKRGDVQMQPDGGGDVSIGISTAAAAALHVESSRTGRGALRLDRSSDVDGTSRDMVSFSRAGAAVGSITCSNTATAYNTSSDYRLKQNVVPITGALNRLMQYKPCEFEFKADPAVRVRGFIAHEVADVNPQAVSGEKDATDDDGKPLYQGVDHSKIVPDLVAAFHEALARIEALEARK
jgi:hypothetical protein